MQEARHDDAIARQFIDGRSGKNGAALAMSGFTVGWFVGINAASGTFCCITEFDDIGFRHIHQSEAFKLSEFTNVEVADGVRWVMLTLEIGMTKRINFCYHIFLFIFYQDVRGGIAEVGL